MPFIAVDLSGRQDLFRKFPVTFFLHIAGKLVGEKFDCHHRIARRFLISQDEHLSRPLRGILILWQQLSVIVCCIGLFCRHAHAVRNSDDEHLAEYGNGDQRVLFDDDGC